MEKQIFKVVVPGDSEFIGSDFSDMLHCALRESSSGFAVLFVYDSDGTFRNALSFSYGRLVS